MIPWPHQLFAVQAVITAILAGAMRICLTSPTGGGKSLIMQLLIEWAVKRGWTVSLYTNRRMLLDQTARWLESAGIQFGIRAAGHDPDFSAPVQLASIQTVESRVLRKTLWQLHNANLVIIDEAHVQKSGSAEEILNHHVKDGAVIVGVTATPVGIGHLYEEIIVAGVTSELKKCGALIGCYTYGPDEPDLSDIGQVKIGEDLTDEQNAKAIMRPGIYGRVIEWWRRLNPDGKPTILFAPGVQESVWFAEQFQAVGIPASHIDATDVIINGERLPSDEENRAHLLTASRNGDTKVVCNRFVLREAIDMPWLYHGIMATVFGTLTSYLQSGGRLLRSYPGMTHVILQDHGGNWHRHGSLNADRQWNLADTNRLLAERRQQALREKKEAEPIVCPRCAEVRLFGSKCGKCGFETPKKSRMVVQSDGTLKPMPGDIYKPLKTVCKPDSAKLWKGFYWQAKKSKNRMTFRQAMGFFIQTHHYRPPENLPLMPINHADWYAPVCQVPMEALYRA